MPARHPEASLPPHPTLASRLLPAACLVLALAGCAERDTVRQEDRAFARERNVAKTSGFGCLAAADELPDDPLAPQRRPSCQVGVLSSVKDQGRTIPAVAVPIETRVCTHTPQGYAIDAAPVIAQRLFDRYQWNVGFVPLQDSPVCPPPPPANAGAALNLATTGAIPLTGPSGTRYVMPTTVEAKLVDLTTGRTLWRQDCHTDPAELNAATSLPDDSNLEQVLSDQADRCVQQLGKALGAPSY